MRTILGLPRVWLGGMARLLLLTLSVTTLGPVLHDEHDAERQSTVILHDESQHHLQAAEASDPRSPGAEHCVACHFVRTSRGPVSWEPAGLHALSSGNRLSHTDGRLPAASFESRRPARAPPLA